MMSALKPATVLDCQNGQRLRRPDVLAEEVPVALVCNGLTQAVMLATPADLEEWALGFALTEGLLAEPGECYGIEIAGATAGIEVQMTVAAACEWRLREQRRRRTGRTGCGLCGLESLAEIDLPLPALPPTRVRTAALAGALAALPALQMLQAQTGAVHAAAWVQADGTLALVREDVGRHNALDKLIGARVRSRQDLREGFALVTSRASFEMVQKAARAGIGALAAVSAPTARAVRVAEGAGLLLIGFARGQGAVAYAHAERLEGGAA